MLNSYRFRACFQGGNHPREGEQNQCSDKDARLGDLYLAVGNLSEALAYYKRAIASIGGNDENARLEVVLKASACLRRQGQAQEALSFVESVQGSFGSRCKRGLLAEKATLLCLVGRYGEAARVCEEARKQEAEQDREKDARIYLVLGHVLARLCRWQQAIVCLEQAATFGRMCGDLTTRGNALNNLGIVYKNLCRFRESARFLEKAVAIARRQDDDASLAVRLLNLANTLFKAGDTEAAHRMVLECHRIATSLNLARITVQSSICRARINLIKGDLNTARIETDRAVSEAERLDDPRLYLICRETQADVLLGQGDHREARRILEDCLARVSPHTKDVEAEIKTRLAAAYLASGQRKRARACAEEAAALAESIGDLYEAGRALRLMGVAGGGDAIEHLSRAEHLFTRIGAQLELGITLHACCRRADLDDDATVGRLERAVRILKRCGARTWLVRALCDLALAYEQAQEHEKALSSLAEALALGGADRERKAIARARVQVDRGFSSRLASKGAARPVSADDAVALLSERFGVGGAVLAKGMPGGVPVVTRVWGIARSVADQLVGFVNSKKCNPLVCSDISDQVGSGVPTDRLGSLLAIRFGKPNDRYLLLAVWPPHGGSRRGGAGPHMMVAAYHGISSWLPVFEAEAPQVRFSGRPICVGGMITADPALRTILISLPRMARGSAGVLIMGETGTGKELVARAIHTMSPRSGKPLVVQNCAALPEHLLESELFGHKAGSFTGARGEKRGLLEIAEGGTFFLDEIGEVSSSIQAKILRAIETGEIRRVGDTTSRTIDARFVSATNKNLEEAVEAGSFRRDLYYRLNVVSVNLPPLRERRGDVELLAAFFLDRFARRTGKKVNGISGDALRALQAYDWPGNVRQLENEIEKSVTMVDPGSAITLDLLSDCIAGVRKEKRSLGLKDELRMVETRRILAALRRSGWNKTHAARLLGDLSRPALIAKMKRLGIPLKRPA
jgi:DNA-binding NtrC family response regulator/tetratricopeptide (TPR) repeat protein